MKHLMSDNGAIVFISNNLNWSILIIINLFKKF